MRSRHRSRLVALALIVLMSATANGKQQPPAHNNATDSGAAAEQRKNIAEERTADYTLGLVVATSLLFGATLVLAVFTYRLWKSTSDMVRNAGNEGRATLAAMGEQREVMANQLEAMQRQADQLEAEYRVTHRPRLTMRSVMFDRVSDEHPDDRPQIRIEIANIGEAEAILAHLSIHLVPLSNRNVVASTILGALEGETHEKLQGRHIANGGSVVFLLNDEAVFDAIATEKASHRGMFILYCVGYFEYTDERGEHPRRTGFIRSANFDQREFDHPQSSLMTTFDYQD